MSSAGFKTQSGKSRKFYSRLATNEVEADVEGQDPSLSPTLKPQANPTLLSRANAAERSSGAGSSQTKVRVPKQPNRTTKTSQKLVVFPEHLSDFQRESQVTDVASEYGEDESAHLVHYPYHIAKEKEAERIRRLNKDILPRVTAYSTARSFNMDAIMKFLLARRDSNGTDPKQFDECIFTPYNPPVSIFQFNPSASPLVLHTPYNQDPSSALPRSDRNRSGSPAGRFLSDRNDNAERMPIARMTPEPAASQTAEDLLRDTSPSPPLRTPSEHLDTSQDDVPLSSHSIGSKSHWKPVDDSGIREDRQGEVFTTRGELFFFDYGVVVMWGLTEPQEKYILSLLTPYEQDKLESDEVETEEFHYQYRPHSQARIFNDIITLRTPIHSSLEAIHEVSAEKSVAGLQPQDHMIKLTISHAIAQSVKLTLFEGRVDDTIDTTKHIPLVMAKTGKVPMSRTAIVKKIGHLFIMRIDVNLVSPILDTPEIFWSEPALEPLYSAIRGYLEISQRVELLNQRCSVISDLLDMLKEHLNSAHGEKLEWIIIILIGIEIIIGLITIFVDIFKNYG